jgi:hypothetical protein
MRCLFAIKKYSLYACAMPKLPNANNLLTLSIDHVSKYMSESHFLTPLLNMKIHGIAINLLFKIYKKEKLFKVIQTFGLPYLIPMSKQEPMLSSEAPSNWINQATITYVVDEDSSISNSLRHPTNAPSSCHHPHDDRILLTLATIHTELT